MARADRTDLQSLDRVREVRGRARGTREVEDRIHRPENRDAVDHVLLDELERSRALPARIDEVRDVLTLAGEEVVDRDDFPVALAQSLAEVRPEEAGAARHDCARHQRPTPW